MGLGDFVGDILGIDEPESSKILSRLSTAPAESPDIQNFLPPFLRFDPTTTGDRTVTEFQEKTGPFGLVKFRRPVTRTIPGETVSEGTGEFLEAGIQAIGDLIQNPGQLSPDVLEAILPRLSAQSESLASDFRGIRSQQEGAAARGNVPVSIKTALASALDVAEARAQRGLERQALTDSDALRRADLNQTFALLDAILQFTSARQGAAVSGLGAASAAEAQTQAALLSALGAIGSGFAA